MTIPFVIVIFLVDYGMDNQKVVVSTLEAFATFFKSLYCHWGPTSLFSNGYWEINWPEYKADHSLPPSSVRIMKD